MENAEVLVVNCGDWACAIPDATRCKTEKGGVPSKKIIRWANACFVAHDAHATAQPCRYTNSEGFPTL